MKRHFSNRGEALAEVTVARCLASRKAPIKTSLMIQADRAIASACRYAKLPASEEKTKVVQ